METLKGILAGIGSSLSVFAWLYFDAKNKRETIVDISKNIDDPSKVQELLDILNDKEEAKEPIDYRRGGVITLFVGVGIYLLGITAMGSFFEGAGALVAAIGVGTMVAGYLYPNTSAELTNAVEKFEEK